LTSIEPAPVAWVALDIPSPRLLKPYPYLVPPALRGEVRPGRRVRVPVRGRKVEGVVLALGRFRPSGELKSVEGVVGEFALPPLLLSLACWVARRYLASPGAALRFFFALPPGKGKPSTPGETSSALAGAPRYELTPEQARAVEEISRGGEGGYLLHGVTGSGKTEVYLRLVERVLEERREAIVLVPEIALTPQVVGVFRERGEGEVEVLHSLLRPGERREAWQRIASGQVKVVVGPRSALFAPLSRVGLIVLDEEHETSYKQEETPRYHAREVARERARREGARLVLGSATPSLEAYALALQGELRLLELPHRVDGRPFPPVRVVDMRSSPYRPFTRMLREAVAERLGRGEQVLLFLNRRGYSGALLCPECGHVPRCSRCLVSLTYYRSSPLLLCHYCGLRRRAPSSCPGCGGAGLRPLGMGTEMVEEWVRGEFPRARVARLDGQTARRAGYIEKVYRGFRGGDIDILVGTQMVAKGWDIENVTLVGVVNADTSLHLPDFRAAEKTFQLLTQVAGRTGRGSKRGEVIVQTYNPHHHAVRAASRHDYRDFFQKESLLREEAFLPPFSRLLRVEVTAGEEKEGERVAGILAQGVRELEVLGPAPCPLYRLRGTWRWHFMVKAREEEKLLEAGLRLRKEGERFRSCRVILDIDPVSIL